MSHFTVLVSGNDHEAALAPYDEEIDVTPYLETDFNPDEEYERAKSWAVDEHNDRKPVGLNLDDQAAVFAWFFEDENVVQENGQWVRYSTYNPKSKWDWYSVGGRWDKELITKDGHGVNETTVGELDIEKTRPTYAVLHDGQWIARGEMGWFGMSNDTVNEEDWPAQWRRVLAGISPDTRLVLIDAHI